MSLIYCLIDLLTKKKICLDDLLLEKIKNKKQGKGEHT